MKTLLEDERKKVLHYIETLVEVAREPFLILDKNLKVIIANDSFYQVFKVAKKDKENYLDLLNGDLSKKYVTSQTKTLDVESQFDAVVIIGKK